MSRRIRASGARSPSGDRGPIGGTSPLRFDAPPTGVKWESCKHAESDVKYVICNADEGEPGTVKDRVILSNYAEHVFMGMGSGAYAMGPAHGIL